MSKILYLSCHEVLEFDEISLFHELGHEVFSPGAYVCNENRGNDTLRPSISGLVYDPNIVEQWNKLCAQCPGQDGKDHLTKEFVNNFQIIVVMHLPKWIINNWEAIKHKRVIWRTIGQSISQTEQQLRDYRNQGMQIVRYSPKETTIPGFIGQDALIRFYKDPEIYKDWNGKERNIITFAQSMKERDQACNYSLFEWVTRPFCRKLFGSGSEKVGVWGKGKVSYEQQLKELRDNQIYFYTGTHPASYTLNFMESWMTGIPIVAIGPKWGNANYFPGHQLYETDSLITHGVDGMVSDDPRELQHFIEVLFSNDSLREKIGTAGRQMAIRHFGKSMISAAWDSYLGR
jgi:glycosyltransferase involved in cell wall biosynthesis